MAIFFVTYDLRKGSPSHESFDAHVKNVANKHARILESVWCLEHFGTCDQLHELLMSGLDEDDGLIVIESKKATWINLLVDDDELEIALSKIL